MPGRRSTIRRSASPLIPLPPFEKPSIQVFWPTKSNGIWQYYFPEQKWIPQVVPPPRKTVYLQADWEHPTGPAYRRSWKKGPSWQVTYCQKGNILTRTAIYVDADSYIAGTIDGSNYSESVVEITTPPKRFLFKAPYYI
jgi:hypothetical protein